jgi:hypothetical protein
MTVSINAEQKIGLNLFNISQFTPQLGNPPPPRSLILEVGSLLTFDISLGQYW